MPATEAPQSPRSQPPRRARLLSPSAWFLSQPRVRAVRYHPKVQWAMTNLGIRRWRTIRRSPPVLLAVAGIATLTDQMHGPRWEQDLVRAAVDIALTVTALSAGACLTRRARRLVGLRSRRTYLVMGTGLLALAVACFTAVARFDAHNNPLPADLFGLIGLLASWPALLALGRALTWGRLRRFCWIYPPAGRPPAPPDNSGTARGFDHA
jgi:hypothetical protein